MQKYILIFLAFITLKGYGQESYIGKEYDKFIFLHQLNVVESKKLPLEKYLEFSKPFSKWESRPLNIEQVWIIDGFDLSSTVPNFIWGSFAKYYDLSVNDAQIKPKIFTSFAYKNKEQFKNDFNKYSNLFEELNLLIDQSDIQILLNQDSLQRVNHLFLENGKYWEYVIPKDSPFPMSDSLINVNGKLFSDKEKKILIAMSELNVYSVYKSKNFTVYLLDGLLDNCYGFIHLNQSDIKDFGHLFRMEIFENVKNSFYFFISY